MTALQPGWRVFWSDGASRRFDDEQQAREYLLHYGRRNANDPDMQVTVRLEREGAPDWDVAVIDGAPEVVVNAAAVAALVKASPLGVEQATANLRAAMTPGDFALIEVYL
jgi:hypothetical protein